MAGPNLSRFLGLFRLRDASNASRLAAVSAAGAVKAEGAGSSGSPSGGIMSVQFAGRLVSTATIANGESLSGAVDLGSASLVAIQMPASWTAASLTFQISHDGTTYADVKDDLGTEFTVNAAASLVIASAAIAATFLGARYLKVRSGTAGVPVNQGAARDIKIIAAA